MKLFRILLMLFLISFCEITLCGGVMATIFFQDDFDEYSDSPANHGWSIASNISVVNGQGINGSKCAMVTYDGPGTSPYWFGVNISNFNLNAIFVRFYFRVDDPSGGCKFLKLFGKRDRPSGYANTTLAIKYTNSLLYEISYGDGSTTINDTQTLIRYSGEHSDSAVNVLVAKGPFDPRDGKWHCYEFYMKFSDDGKRNGEYKIWIDGSLRVHAVNIKNRNDQNSNEFDSVQLANYCSDLWSHTWHIWYDNVVISDEYIGPIGWTTNDEPPNPPKAFEIPQ